MKILPISAVVPTRNRTKVFSEALRSLEQQEVFPAELIVVDASDEPKTREMLNSFAAQLGAVSSIRWMPARMRGAAVQRNQGVSAVTHPVVWFFDDDIRFEPECVIRLWRALNSDLRLGGVNAMIVNQRYQPPGPVSRTLFRILHGRSEPTYAGRVIGPAVNLLPEDCDHLPEVVSVEWLNTTCTLYRREALPTPAFDSMFVGYSLLEDLTLSLQVGKGWRLANARTARIFHDSQPGSHKDDVTALAAMELINRHYVMTKILGRNSFRDYLRLLAWEMFQLGACAAEARSRSMLGSMTIGKWNATCAIAAGKRQSNVKSCQ